MVWYGQGMDGYSNYRPQVKYVPTYSTYSKYDNRDCDCDCDNNYDNNYNHKHYKHDGNNYKMSYNNRGYNNWGNGSYNW